MKKLFLCCFIYLLLANVEARAQSGFEAGNYYQRQYQISDNPVSQAIRKYDYYGRYLGVYQIWQRAEWHSESGGQYIYVWEGSQWESRWSDGGYYWYTWVDYEKFMGY